MIVQIEEIGEKGLELSEELSEALLSEWLAQPEGFPESARPRGPARVEARLSRAPGGVLVRARATIALRAPCKRCLKEVSFELALSLERTLVEEGRAARDDERAAGAHSASREDGGSGERGSSFALDESEVDLFDGRKIELAPLLREELLLELPMDLLCDEVCKGLCPLCGSELNAGDCGCERTVPDPRWAALRTIKV